MASKFYVCTHCGNIIGKIKDTGVPVVCCGEPMKELVANSTDAAGEKHVPVATVEGNKVTVVVGEVNHPMTDAHLIEWISVETTHGWQRKTLTSADEPKAEFALAEGEEAKAVYGYCNLHGLWKADL